MDFHKILYLNIFVFHFKNNCRENSSLIKSCNGKSNIKNALFAFIVMSHRILLETRNALPINKQVKISQNSTMKVYLAK
jgi:hypothetical protein